MNISTCRPTSVSRRGGIFSHQKESPAMEYASLCGQIAANTRWSRMNSDQRTAATSAGRLAAEKRFERLVDPTHVPTPSDSPKPPLLPEGGPGPKDC